LNSAHHLVLSTHLRHQALTSPAVAVHLLFQYRLAIPVLQENSEDGRVLSENPGRREARAHWSRHPSRSQRRRCNRGKWKIEQRQCLLD